MISVDEVEYCYMAFNECSFGIYQIIKDIAKKYRFDHVYDIGCCIGLQGKLFTSEGILYTGVEECKEIIDYAYKGNGINYLHGKYPFSIQTKESEVSCAVSSLCLGYTTPNIDTYCQLQKDFKYFIGSIGNTDRELFHKFFEVKERYDYGIIVAIRR